MALKYPVMRELVIVVSDLYLPEEGRGDSLALPGLERIARFGRKNVLAERLAVLACASRRLRCPGPRGAGLRRRARLRLPIRRQRVARESGAPQSPGSRACTWTIAAC